MSMTQAGFAHEGAQETNYLQAKKGLMSWLYTVDHKRIGVMFLASVLSTFLLGGVTGVEQLGAVDVQRLGDCVGLLTPAEIWAVDDALATVLGLS